MSNIYLIRIDQPDEREFNVPQGDTTLGRGSILECDDKRISRKHGLLQVSEDGTVSLISLHTNPCFYKSQGGDAYALLLKGQSQVLQTGDEFSLLPNSFKYRVLKRGESVPPVAVESETLGVSLSQISQNHVTKENGNATGVSDEQEAHTTPSSPYTAPTQRKRVLPEWLRNMSATKPSTSAATVREDESAMVAKKARTDEVDEKQPEMNVKLEPDVPNISAVPRTTTTPPDGGQLHQMSDDEDDVKLGGSPKKGVTPKKEASPTKDGYEAEYGAASSTTTTTPTAGTTARERCVYGANCYRRNPQHRTDFSHPGDADYIVNQNLPECPYGTACYRKNLQHRKDFQHTQPPHMPPTSPQQANGDPTQSNINYYSCNVTYNMCPRCRNTTFVDLTKDDLADPD